MGISMETLAAAKSFTRNYVAQYGGVKEIYEYSSKTAFPSTGETDVFYVATDTERVYRWSGSTYVEVSPSEIDALAVAANNGKIVQIVNGAFAAVTPDSVFPDGDSVDY